MTDTITLLLSSILGGTVVALINWARAERTAKKESKIQYLNEQIRNLYGRLFYYISQNDKLFELNKKIP